MLIPVKDRFLIANVQNDFTGNVRIKGILSVWKPGSGLYPKRRMEALQAVEAQFPEKRKAFLPYQFDFTTASDLSPVLRVALPLGALVGLLMVILGLSLIRRSKIKVIVS